jgi:hypothetical protein
VPLADREGRVVAPAEDLRQVAVLGRDGGVVAGEAGRELDDAAIPLAWWFRPVSRHARVGEHSAVVWKLENRRPPAARRSKVGVAMSEP